MLFRSVEINSFNINDNLTRSLYAQATLNTNLSKELIKVEGCLDGVWSNLDFDYASGDGLSKNIKIKSLLSSRTYQIKVSYIHSDKFTTNTQVANTEDAMQLTNGVFNDWSETTINGGNGTYNGKIVCDYVAGWSTLNDKTTYGAKDCWSTLWSGDYGVNWRFCSGTVKTTDITSGTYAAEISTLAFYNKDVNGAWKEESVYNYTRDNGTAYPGLLFLGSVSGETGYYTLGVDHNSRPDSFTFDYKYTPIEGDNCIAYAVVYGNPLLITIIIPWSN